MTHRVTFSGAARRQLKKLPRATQERLLAAAEALGAEPRPDGCRKLAGQSAWRIRVGAFRMIYEVEDAELVVLVLRVGDRKDIYKRK